MYMLLDNFQCSTDEKRRGLYVGITRARANLYIHCNNGIFDGFKVLFCKKITDENIYWEPNELTVQLTHRDINLGFFKGKKEFILSLVSGSRLILTEKGMGIEFPNGMREALRYSKSFCNGTLQSLNMRGYKPIGGTIRFIAARKSNDNNEECAVILPDVYFGKE